MGLHIKRLGILHNTTLPIYEQDGRFHLVVSSSASFFSVLQFSKYRPFTSLVKFIPRYFSFIFCSYSKWDFFLSFSFWYFTVGVQNAIDFWIWTLYLLLRRIHLLGPVVFWWRLQGFLRILPCHLQVMTVLLPPLQSGCLLLLWVGPPTLCWLRVVKADTLVLLLTLRETLHQIKKLLHG